MLIINPESMDTIKKTLESLSIEELETVIEMANEIKIIKKPFYKIRDDFIILSVETNDISQIGNSFNSDSFTYIVTSTWQIKSKMYELMSVAEGWMSYGDSEITSSNMKWNTRKPNKVYCRIAEYIAKKMSESIREEFDEEDLEKMLNENKELKEMLEEL